MYHPKYARRKRPGKAAVAVWALGFCLCCLTGGSLALLTAATEPAVNLFHPAGNPVPVIQESFTGREKSNVYVTNTGEVSCYVRAIVTVNLIDEDGAVAARGITGDDYSISYSGSWRQGSDGFWYYPLPVSPGGSTAALINSCTSLTEDYRLEVTIASQLVQSRPKRAVEEVWGVSVDSGGNISK